MSSEHVWSDHGSVGVVVDARTMRTGRRVNVVKGSGHQSETSRHGMRAGDLLVLQCPQ